MSLLYRIHANLFAAPAETKPGPTVTLRGLELPTLVGVGGGPPRFIAPLPVTFDEMQQRLLALPRSDCEPDGFFLVTGGKVGNDASPFWRLNGHLHELPSTDDAAKLHRVELNGECPVESFDAVLNTLGWPPGPLVFELVQEGVSVDEPTFRQWAAA